MRGTGVVTVATRFPMDIQTEQLNNTSRENVERVENDHHGEWWRWETLERGSRLTECPSRTRTVRISPAHDAPIMSRTDSLSRAKGRVRVWRRANDAHLRRTDLPIGQVLPEKESTAGRLRPTRRRGNFPGERPRWRGRGAEISVGT
jgi:hypothetical protein